jgi:hypothetical protein
MLDWNAKDNAVLHRKLLIPATNGFDMGDSAEIRNKTVHTQLR